MEYSFTQTEDGPTLGLHKAGRWDEVLQIDKCWITSDVDNAIRNTMRDWAREEKLTAYDQETHEGYLRHLMVRVGRNTGQALVQLVTNRGERFDRERLIEVLTAIPEVKSIHWSVNEGVSETTELPTELIWGEDAIEEEIGGLRFRVRQTPSCRRTPRWPSSSTRSRASSPVSRATKRSTTSTAGSGRSGSRWPRTR